MSTTTARGTAFRVGDDVVGYCCELGALVEGTLRGFVGDEATIETVQRDLVLVLVSSLQSQTARDAP